MAFKITIEVEGGKSTATIKDDAGNEAVVNGLVLFGCDQHQSGNLYTFAWGSPADAAYAVGEGLAQTTARRDPFYEDFYKCLLMQMVSRTKTQPNRQEVTVDELLDRWSREPDGEDDPGKWN